MDKVNINGVELEVNFGDADFVERFEDASAEMLKRNDEIKADKTLRATQGMRELCKCVNEYFDTIFGEGTAEELFHGNNDVMDHIEAVDKLDEAQGKLRTRMNNLTNKYQQKNRANINRQNKAQFNQFIGGKA